MGGLQGANCEGVEDEPKIINYTQEPFEFDNTSVCSLEERLGNKFITLTNHESDDPGLHFSIAAL
jgi:hypothetical protein